MLLQVRGRTSCFPALFVERFELGDALEVLGATRSSL